jgi:hypothetical protein
MSRTGWTEAVAGVFKVVGIKWSDNGVLRASGTFEPFSRHVKAPSFTPNFFGQWRSPRQTITTPGQRDTPVSTANPISPASKRSRINHLACQNSPLQPIASRLSAEVPDSFSSWPGPSGRDTPHSPNSEHHLRSTPRLFIALVYTCHRRAASEKLCPSYARITAIRPATRRTP